MKNLFFTVNLCGSLLQLPGHLVGLAGEILPPLLEGPGSQLVLHGPAAAAGTGGAELQAGL